MYNLKKNYVKANRGEKYCVDLMYILFSDSWNVLMIYLDLEMNKKTPHTLCFVLLINDL